jgi:hypothetical protein
MVNEGNFARMLRTNSDDTTVIIQDMATGKGLAISVGDLMGFTKALKPQMERVEAFSNVREMTPEVLLELTQSHKYQEIKRTFSQDIGPHNRLVVSQQDIENMGETLKMIVFFVSPAIIRGAVELAKEKSVLGVNPNWLR